MLEQPVEDEKKTADQIVRVKRKSGGSKPGRVTKPRREYFVPTSKMFQPIKEDYSSEEILAKVPDVIEGKDISLDGRSDNNRRKLFAKYKAMGKKYKWYNEDDRIRAASVYAMTGNSKRVEEITGIPAPKIREWKTSEWWPQIIDRIRQDSDDALDVKLTKLIDETVESINDRLKDGDYIYNNKTGELVRKPIGGKEMAVMTSIFVDKRTLLRKKPTSSQQQASVGERLKKLAEEFEKFTKSRDITKESLDNALQTEQGQTPSKEVVIDAV